MKKIKEKTPYVASIGIDVYENRVRVKTYGHSDKYNKLLTDSIDMKQVIFENIEIPSNDIDIMIENAPINTRSLSPLKGGYGINLSTLTICATKNGSAGFIMAAHDTGFGQDVYLGGNLIGVCKSINASGTDSAWIELTNPTYYMTNDIIGGYEFDGTASSWYPVGTPAYMYGKSSGRTSTTIKRYDSYFYVWGGGYSLSDVVVLNDGSSGGDSGGPVTVKVQGYELSFAMISAAISSETHCSKSTNIKS